MMVGDLNEMQLVSVLKRGIPNEECVAIKVTETLNAGQYGIMLGSYIGSQGVRPYRDNMFWFGDATIEKNDWIFIYTGTGTARHTKDESGNTYSIYWGRDTTLFADTNVVPLIFRVDAVNVLQPKSNVPQIGNA